MEKRTDFQARIDEIGEKMKTPWGYEALDEGEREDFEDYLARSAELMNIYHRQLKDACERLTGVNYRIWYRQKSVAAIQKKLKSEGSGRLSRMADVAGVRVVIDPGLDGMSQEKWSRSLGGMVNYMERAVASLGDRQIDVENGAYLTALRRKGYQAKYLVYERDEVLIEIQIRTFLEHLWISAIEIVHTILLLEERYGWQVEDYDDDYWGRFFELASQVFGIIDKRKTGDLMDVTIGMEQLACEHSIMEKLENYKHIIDELIVRERAEDADWDDLVVSVKNLTAPSIIIERYNSEKRATESLRQKEKDSNIIYTVLIPREEFEYMKKICQNNSSVCWSKNLVGDFLNAIQTVFNIRKGYESS